MFNYDMSTKGAHDYVMGTDESGRGSLAGPVVGAAVILSPEASQLPINDSKKLSAKSREELYEQIIQNSVAYHIEMLDANYIDSHGIQKANTNVLAISRMKVIEKLSKNSKIITIADGNPLWHEEDLIWVQHADSLSLSVAAASILAKVFRDRIMIDLDAQYEYIYRFSQHKGYGTKIHKNIIRQYGKIRDVHRITFTTDIPNIWYN